MFTSAMPRLIAHRGCTLHAPQNSLPAFTAAGQAGYWAIETDVHQTADGVLVCNHNESIDAMYDGTGNIAAMPFCELRQRRIRSELCPEPLSDGLRRMPTFAEYLEICRNYHVIPFIESKCDAIPQLLSQAFAYFPEDKIVLSSLTFSHLEQARQCSPRVFLHHIFSDRAHIARLCEMRPAGVSLNEPDLATVPADLADTLHEKGLRLCLRAADTPEALQKMMVLGLDYIPTNRLLPK